jgi:RNA polymerase sigma-70 factor, ECF subfamily
MTGSSDPAVDAALVREIAAGSEAALGLVYDRHADAVYAASSRLTDDRQIAEEVVQETFLALWNRAELFNPAAGSLAAWLHTIARNRTIDRLRAMGRRPRLVPISSIRQDDETDGATLERVSSHGTVVGGGDSVGLGPEGELAALEVRLAIRQVLDGMPELERTVILLAYRDQLTQAEIATQLGWPIGTVKTRTRRALLRMRQALADATDDGARGDSIAVPIVNPIGGTVR